MTAPEKKKFLVRGVDFNGQNVEKFSRVVKAHSADDAKEFMGQKMDPNAVIYSVAEVTDVDSEEALSSALVPWFGGYGITR